MVFLETVLLIFFLVALPCIVIFSLLMHGFDRIDEFFNHRKTLRRMNDFTNVYFDYNHKIWIDKIIEE